MLILTIVCCRSVCTLSLATSQKGGACTLCSEHLEQMCVGYLLAPEQRTVTLLLQIFTNPSLCVAHTLLGNIEFLPDSYKKKKALFSLYRKANRYVGLMRKLSKASSLGGRISVPA